MGWPVRWRRRSSRAPAAPLYERAVQANPASIEGWRGLFLAQVEAGNAPLALATDKRIPAAIHVQLMRDPAYMRALASSYSAVGRDPDAQKTLEAALQLPFAADAKKVKTDMQVQLAGILLASNHLEQAATLYSQVLALDAWEHRGVAGTDAGAARDGPRSGGAGDGGGNASVELCGGDARSRL